MVLCVYCRINFGGTHPKTTQTTGLLINPHQLIGLIHVAVRLARTHPRPKAATPYHHSQRIITASAPYVALALVHQHR